MDGVGVSCVIAAWNEAPTIALVVDGIRRHTPGLIEVVVVDDGSSDDTAGKAGRAGARVVRLERNGGKGVALRRGIEAARGDRLLFIDGDGQDDPSEVGRLVDALGPDVGMVIGSRFIGTFLEGSVTPLNHLGNRILTRAFDVLYNAAITDAQAGFRLVRRDALDPARLTATRYEIEADVAIQVLNGGWRIVEVPVTRAARQHGRSGFRSFYHGARILAWMLRGRFAGLAAAAARR
jgi:glycosyltransferase involved in cell wall biosynthesis